MAKELKDLTKRADNYSQWYNDLVESRFSGAIGSTGVHGNKALWICDLGKNATSARRYV